MTVFAQPLDGGTTVNREFMMNEVFFVIKLDTIIVPNKFIEDTEDTSINGLVTVFRIFDI